MSESHLHFMGCKAQKLSQDWRTRLWPDVYKYSGCVLLQGPWGVWAGREPSLNRAAGTGGCMTAHTCHTVYTCRQRPELNPSYQVSHQLHSKQLTPLGKAAVGCFLHNVLSLLLYCSHQIGWSPVLFQVPLGSPSIVNEPKTSCIYKLKIALVLGELLCGSCGLPKPQCGQHMFCSNNMQLTLGP